MPLGGLDVGKIVAHVGIEWDKRNDQGDEFDRRLKGLRADASKDVVAHARVESDLTGAALYERKLAQLRSRKDEVKAKLGADFDPREFDRYEKRLEDARRKAANRDAYKAVLSAEVDSASFADADREMTKMGRGARDSGRGLDDLKRAAGGAGGAIGGGGRGLTGNVGFLSGSLRILVPLLAAGIPAVIALGGALTALAGSASAAAAGMAAVGVGAGAALLPIVAVGAAVASRLTLIGEASKAMDTQQEQSATVAQSSAERQRSASESIRSATEALHDTQRQAQRAQQDLTRARAEARRELEDLALAADRSVLSERRAAIGLEEARKRLEEVELDPNTTRAQRREAKLAVDEAKQNIREAQVERRRAHEDEKAGTDTVRQARDQLADAERNVARARRGVASASAAAAASNQQQAAAVRNADAALAKLTESERRLLTTWRRFRGTVRETFRPATDEIMGALDDALERTEPWIARFKSRFRGIGREIGEQIDAGSVSLTGPRWTRAFDSFGRTAERVVKPVTNAIGSALEALANIAVGAQPLVVEFAEWLERAFGSMARGTRDGEKVRDVIRDLVEHTKSWARFMGAVGRLIYTVFNGGKTEGKGLVDTITDVVNGWSDFLETEEGQDKMREFFHEAVEVSKELAKAVGEIVEVIGDLWDGFTDLAHFMDEHRELIELVAKAWLGYRLAMIGARRVAGLRRGWAPAVAATTPAAPGGGRPAGGRQPRGRDVNRRGPDLRNAARGGLDALAIAGATIAIGDAIKGPRASDLGLLIQYRKEIDKLAASGEKKGLQSLAERLRETARAQGDATKGENLNRLADSIDKLIKTGDRQGLKKLAADLRATKIAGDDGALRAIAKGLDQIADSSKDGAKDVDRLRKETKELEGQLGRTRKGSSEYRETAERLRAKQRELNRAMADAEGSGRKGARGPRALGRSAEAAAEAAGDAARLIALDFNRIAEDFGLKPLKYTSKRTGSRKSATGDLAGARGDDNPLLDPVFKARGGWIGARGMVSRDVVPIGDRTIAAYGEYDAHGPGGRRAIINRHQAPVVDTALAMNGLPGLDQLPAGRQLPLIESAMSVFGGLDRLFQSIDTPHYFARGGIVPIPGEPGEFIHKSILADVLALKRRYKLDITDGYATSGHAPGGEHPKGLAIDAVPGRGGSWDLIDQMARWARGKIGKGLRWLGYDGVPNHGRGHHIHLSWQAGKSIGAGGGADQVRRVLIGGPRGKLRDVAQKSADRLRGGANRTIDRQLGAIGGGPGDAHPQSTDPSVIAGFRRAIRTTKARPVERLALWMAGLVESGLRNLNYGDRDSVGALQQRASQGWTGLMNPYRAAIEFLNRARALAPWRGSAGRLAQAVQRSAFPARYDQMRTAAMRYMSMGGRIRRFASGGYTEPHPTGSGYQPVPSEAVGPHPTGRAYVPASGGGGGGGASTGVLSIAKLRSMNTGRIKSYDDELAAAQQGETDYQRMDRRFAITDEELINQDTGEVNWQQVGQRAHELEQLLRQRERIVGHLRRARTIAKRIVKSFNTILSKLRRARKNVKGTKTFKKTRRAYYDGRIRAYQGSLSEFQGKLAELDTNTLPDAILDRDETAAELAAVRGTQPQLRDQGDAGDPGGDTGAFGDSGSSEPAAGPPDPAEVARQAIAMVESNAAARADAFASFGSNFRTGYSPRFGSGDRTVDGAGARYFGATGAGDAFDGGGFDVAGASGGGGQVGSGRTVNQYITIEKPPPEPHLWAKDVGHELNAM